MQDPVLVAYIAAGLVLPLFNLPQILACAVDRDGLKAYSLTKTVGQIACRLAMLPFIVQVGSLTMVVIVTVDLAARLVELAVAALSLRRVGWTWGAIGRRIWKIDTGAAREPEPFVIGEGIK